MEKIFRCEITTLSIQDCISKIVQWIEQGEEQKYFVCANPHSLEVARKDQIFAKAIRNADLIVADGVGIIIASRILGLAIKKRVTGPDIFWGLSNALNQKRGFSVFFLGSDEVNLTKIKEKMRLDFPNIFVAGTYSPPFKTEFSNEENKLMVEAINRAKPNVLWVGLTAPKQEKWIYKNKNSLNVNFIGAIGAVFDFYTGNVKRPHPVFQKMGLEWLPRFLREPRRLWGRNLISNPCFFLRVIKYRFMKRL
jgi:N-acetylglucosaminyldiphosphoundecaprenol N-acetyl-beta-D-mannosaminyltransferase